jgi:hypothetical protein
MKSILLPLLLLPLFILAQDEPLIQKIVTPEKLIKQDVDDLVAQTLKKSNSIRHMHEKNNSMFPKSQIGYVMNPTACPFGLNYYQFQTKTVGWYLDIKTDFNIFAPGYSWERGTSSGQPVGNEISGKGYDVFVTGIALNLIKSKYNATILYVGYGISSLKNFQRFDQYGDDFYESRPERNGNINIGVLRQSTDLVSWQVGFDSQVRGINFGMGFTF